jgi:hypothetical protein
VSGVTPGYYGSFYDANANQTISSTTSAYLIRVANTFEQNGVTVVNNTNITFAYTGTYEIIYSIQFFNNDNQQQDINVWFYKNGNNNINNSDSKFTISGKSGSNKGKLIAVSPFVSTFNAGDYVRLVWAATATGVEITSDAAGTTPTTPVVPGVIVTVKQISNIISAPPGTNSSIIFNDSGVSNATVGFTFNKTTNNVTIGNSLFVTQTVNASALTINGYFTANSTFVYANNGVNFKPKAGSTTISTEGSVFYDSLNHALNVYTDTATPHELGQQTFVRVYNATDSTITKGTAVYVNGASFNRPTIGKAIADGSIRISQSVGVVFDDIPGTTEGFVLTGGLLQNFDTRNYSIGQQIYISPTTAGNLSNTEPSYPNYSVPIGYALNSALSGQIYITAQISTLTLPNTNIYISNGTSAFVSNNFTFDYANSVLKIGNTTVNGSIGYINDSGTTTFLRLNGNSNSSLDADITNYSLGTNASSDFAAYDSNGPTSSNFIDMGISGVNFSQSYWTISGPSDGYLYTGNSALAIGTAVASPIKFFTGGTLAANEKMRIVGATGNVGIGNTNPADKLSVNGTTYLGANVNINGVANISGNLVVGGANFSITSDGNVGIGNTNPADKLSVNGTSYLGGNVNINGVANISGNLVVGGANFSITSGGNVGIGNTNPQDKLSVNGTSYLGGNVTITGNLIITGTTVTVNAATLDVKDLNITVAKGAATAAVADGAGLTVDTANIGWYYNNASNTWQSNVGITPSANNTFNLGASGLVWSNVYANNVNGTNVYGTLQTASQPNITANNSTNLGGTSAANFVQNTDSRTLSGNIYFTGTNNYFANTIKVGANVYANTSHFFVGNSTTNSTFETAQIKIANTSQYANLNAGSLYLGNSGVSATVNSTIYTGTSLLANNSSYVGGAAASATSAVANRIVQADGNGYIFNNYFNSTDDVSSGTISNIIAKFGDNYYRSATAAKVSSFLSLSTTYAALAGATFSGSVSVPSTLYFGGVSGGVNANSNPLIYADGTNMAIKPGSGNGSLYFQDYSGTTKSQYSFQYGDWFIHYMYDKDDSAYYIDMNGTSRFATVRGDRFWTGYDSGVTNSFSCSGWFRSNSSSGWYNETYGGGINMEDSTYVRVYNGKQFYCSTAIWGTILYDANDSGYYVDPTGTSRTNVINSTRYQSQDNWWWDAAGRERMLWVGTSHNYYKCNDMHVFRRMDNYDLVYIGSDGNIWMGTYRDWLSTQIRSGIFYDQNDTGYYCDPNSTSRFVRTNINTGEWNYSSDGWVRLLYQNGASTIQRGGATSQWTFEFQNHNDGSTRWLMAHAGDFYAAGNITAYWSDKRLKKNIEKISDWKEILAGINGYRFQWNDIGKRMLSKEDDEIDVGLIAQEVQAVYPHGAAIQMLQYKNQNPDGTLEPKDDIDYDPENPYLTVREDKLIPVLVEALKAHDAEIEQLKEKIRKLENILSFMS